MKNIFNISDKVDKIYLIYDYSGSVGSDKIDIYRRIRDEIEKLNKNFLVIQHTTTAIFNCNFNKLLDGGTYVSSGIKLAFENNLLDGNDKTLFLIIGDGDNWCEDNPNVPKWVSVAKNNNIDVKFIGVNPASYCTHIWELKEVKKQLNEEDLFILDNMNDLNKHISELKKPIKLFNVEHSVDGKIYTFNSNNVKAKNGDIVICDTSMGKTYGKIVATITEHLTDNEAENKYKKILAKYK